MTAVTFQVSKCGLTSLLGSFTGADIAEIVEQKQTDGILSYYVHYVDCKHSCALQFCKRLAFHVAKQPEDLTHV